jgi:hypothetical protein
MDPLRRRGGTNVGRAMPWNPMTPDEAAGQDTEELRRVLEDVLGPLD